MNVTELIDELSAMFPRFNKSWEKRYREVLHDHAGPALDAAFKATMADWNKTVAPRPADFLKRMSTPTSGPAFNTRDRVLWDKAWSESFGRHAGWTNAFPREEAERLGYIEHFREIAKRAPNRRAE